MPRRPRLEIPGIPMHVTHRGVNRAAVFVDACDFETYRLVLGECCRREGVAVHAYVLMTNHVHLLVSTSAVGAVSRTLCRLGQRYVPNFNRRHGRTGTLWEGRFKSCLVDSDAYLLAVYRYIELNPVRAAMVARAEEWRWSSVRANLALEADELVAPHPLFVEFAREPSAYRELLQDGLSGTDLDAIRAHVRQERALGGSRFQSMVERTLNRPASYRPRGRPRRVSGPEFKR